LRRNCGALATPCGATEAQFRRIHYTHCTLLRNYAAIAPQIRRNCAASPHLSPKYAHLNSGVVIQVTLGIKYVLILAWYRSWVCIHSPNPSRVLLGRLKNHLGAEIVKNALNYIIVMYF